MLTEEKLDPVTEKRLHDAIALQQADQANQAIIQYQLILNAYPEHALVHHLLGITLAQCGTLDRAQKSLQTAVSLQPQNPHYLSSLANLLRRQGDIDQATSYFENALKLNPQLVSAHNNLALIFFSNNVQRAELHLRKALTIMPDHVDANYNLGLLLHDRNRHQAKLHFERAAHSDNQFIPARYQLAQIYQAEKAHRKAIMWYQSILQVMPTHAESLYKIGLTYLELDDTTQGLDYLERAHQIQPELDDIHHNLACVYHHLKRYQDALTHWLKHHQKQPDITTTYNIGVCYLYLGRYQDAQDHLYEVIRLSPDHHSALVNLGATFLQRNQSDLACEYYERAQAIHPSAAISHVLSALKQDKSHQNTAPPAYVTDLFDNYALHYDNHLCDVLDYQLPKRLSHMISSLLNLAPTSSVTLDLGCGTGLCAHALRPVSRKLVGIDLSQNMLDQALKKSQYDSVICANIETLQTDYKGLCDLLLCADTMPYIGDLNQLFTTTAQYLKGNGYWIFSIEDCHDHDFILNQTARFSHNPDYIRCLCESHGFTVYHHERLALRTQQNAYVDGIIFILQKNHSSLM